MISVNSIFQAIKDQDLKKIEEIISIDSKVISSTIHSGLTPIMYSVMYSDELEPVEFLLNNGANLIERDCYYNSLIHLLVKNNNKQILTYLLSKGMDVNTVNENGESPLQYACFWSNEEMVNVLVSEGADIHHIDNNNKSVIDWAMKYSSNEILSLLIKDENYFTGRTDFRVNNNSINPIVSIITESDLLDSRNESREAGEILRKSIAIDPENYDINYRLGCLNVLYLEFNEAIKYFTNSLLIDSTIISSWNKLCETLYYDNKYLDCIDIGEQLISTFGIKDPFLYECLVRSYYIIKNYAKALEHSLKCIETYNEYINILAIVGNIYLVKGNCYKALNYYNKFINSKDMNTHDIYSEDYELLSFLDKLGCQSKKEIHQVILQIFKTDWKWDIFGII